MKAARILPAMVCVVLCTVALKAQYKERIGKQALHFQLEAPAGPIDFIVADTMLGEKKPVMLFCQGSLPVPLFVRFEDNYLYLLGGGISNFDVDAIRKRYHLVVLSMPETPLICAQRQLNDAYCYIPDTTNRNKLSDAFYRADQLDNYATRAITVLKYLRKQSWVDKKELVVAGHSQGAKVATKVALKYPKVTKLGLFGANPFGRADQFVRQARKQAEKGEISWVEADREMEAQYDFFRTVHHPDSLALHPEYLAWKSFSEPLLNDWLQLKMPVYLAYGTQDLVADNCDIVPLFFIREGKKNLKMKRYLNLEHNFFEVEPDGRADYNKAHWPEVMQAFLEWNESN